MDRRLLMVALVSGSLATLPGAVAAYQGARPISAAAKPEPATLTGFVDFQTKVGSFKILSPSSTVKALGKIAMSFQGTVLIVGLEGSATPGPGVKVQYDDPKHSRKIFFGKGTLAIEGKWRAVQFFGRDFKGQWNGMGIMRLRGEFDDKLETGTYQVRGFPKEPWGDSGREIVIPMRAQGSRVKPRIEDVKPGKRPG